MIEYNLEKFKKVINKLNEEDYDIIADYVAELETEISILNTKLEFYQECYKDE